MTLLLGYAPCILEKKAQKIRASMDLENGPIKTVLSVFERTDKQA